MDLHCFSTPVMMYLQFYYFLDNNCGTGVINPTPNPLSKYIVQRENKKTISLSPPTPNGLMHDQGRMQGPRQSFLEQYPRYTKTEMNDAPKNGSPASFENAAKKKSMASHASQ